MAVVHHEPAHGAGEVQDCGTVVMGHLGAHSVLSSKVMLSPCSCYVIRIHAAHVSTDGTVVHTPEGNPTVLEQKICM